MAMQCRRMPHLHPHSHNFRDWLYAFAPVGAAAHEHAAVGAAVDQRVAARRDASRVGAAAHQLPCSGVFSFNGAYRVSKHLKLSAGLDNLFDKRYSEHLNRAGDAGFGFSADTRVNEPGRTAWTRLDLSF